MEVKQVLVVAYFQMMDLKYILEIHQDNFLFLIYHWETQFLLYN